METSKINHEVVNVTRSKSSESQQESSAAKFYQGQVGTTSEQSTAKTDEISTTEAEETVDDSQSVSELANTQTRKEHMASAPPGQLSDVKTKLMEIRQKVDRNRARWIRLGCEWFGRRTIMLASEETR